MKLKIKENLKFFLGCFQRGRGRRQTDHMKPKWKIKDIIDLEYFLYSDEDDGDDSARTARIQRDRDIYLNHIAPFPETENALSKRSILRLWLEQRRNNERKIHGPNAVLPGEAFQEIYRFLIITLAILGGFIGSGVAISLLSYSGKEPSNISAYLGVLVLFQMILLALVILFLLVKLTSRSFFRHSIIISLLGNVLIKMILGLKNSALKRLSSSRQNHVKAAVGLAKGKKRIYGSLFYWPVFILIQVFGIGFNIGVLVATLLKILGSDIAFGWQSTIQVGSQAVYALVKFIALPWSWFVPSEIAHPSLTQVEGSRIVLKDGIHFLITQDLTAWWPFLCFAVLFYGLLPRTILFGIGLVFQSRLLEKQAFSHGACDTLIRRMKNPVVRTEGRTPASGQEPYPTPGHMRSVEASPFIEPDRSAENGVTVLVPEDIHDMCPDDELKAAVFAATGYRVNEKIIVGKDYEADQAVLDALSRKAATDASLKILILQEAWQPPIQETFTFVQNLRNAIGEKFLINVALIGKPEPETIFTVVKKADWDIWRHRFASLGDPYLHLERLVANASV